jgi:hypothetical protein
MKSELPIEELLRWRLARAEAEAPPAPRAARLLELARPWWETWPEKFQALADRLASMQVAFGHAMAEQKSPRTSHPVAALIVGDGQESETTACVLYLNIREGRLRLRFKLEFSPGELPQKFQVTFVEEQGARALFIADAMLSSDSEYRLDAALSDELGRSWESLKVVDRMPFRMILHEEPPTS